MKRIALSVILLLALTFATGVDKVDDPSSTSTYEHSVPLFDAGVAKMKLEHYERQYLQEKREVAVTSIPKEPTPAKKKTYISDDLYWLSRIVSAEAKGESTEGQIAVANVVLNRVASDEFPDTIKDVIFQKGQFSPVGNGTINDEPTKEAIESAKKALEGEKVVDSGVLYFYNTEIASSDWISKRKTVKTIGNHTFSY